MSPLTSFVKQLEQKEQEGLLRRLEERGKRIDFASNDYLGFAHHPRLKMLALEAWKKHGGGQSGATGSRLLTGHTGYADKLEARIAAYHKSEAALLFNSGYAANLGLLSAILTLGSICLVDEAIHASCHDGLFFSRGKRLKWKHNDVSDLESKLTQLSGKKTCYVLVESLYSTDGSLAPLSEIAALCHHHQAHLIVDEAHAAGVIGEHGEGAVASQGLESVVFARTVAFGKAIGVFGAAILCPEIVKQYLINHARSLIYSTMLPPFILCAIDSAYSLLPHAKKERASLAKHFTHMAGLLPPSKASGTQIQPIFLGPSAKNIAQQIRLQGYDVRALTPPTVPRGQECLRICLHATNTTEEIDGLVNALATFI